MDMKRKFNLLFVVALMLCVVGCQTRNGDLGDGMRNFVDDYGDSVMVPAHPQRIVSVSPAITEILFALGANDRLVGRTDFCHYPEEASEIESIGGISNLNIEKILSLHPDLVISGSMVPEKTVQHLLSLGVPVACVIEKSRFDDLYQNILNVGKLVGMADKAEQLNAGLQQRLASVLDSLGVSDLDDNQRPSVYYVVGYGKEGNYTAGGNTFINDIIRMAGGNNVAEGITGWNFSIEALMAADPNYVMIRKEDADAFCRMPPYNKLRAVREGNVIAIESGLVDLQVPRNIDGIIFIAKALHDK